MSDRPHSWRQMTTNARAFIVAVVVVGLCVLIYAVLHGESTDALRFLSFLIVAMVASRMKVNLPGITGTMSVNFLFILLGILLLSFSETMALGCAAVLVQCFYRDRPSPLQVVFNVCAAALAIGASYTVYHLATIYLRIQNGSLLLVIAACTYFATNTLPVAGIIALTEHKSLKKIWADCYFWSFPYYLVGAGIAGMMSWLSFMLDWQTSLLVLPVVYLIYRSYRLYLGRLEDETRHVGEIADLHMRTIEALALAIEAKDHTTHDHLQRVRVYAVEVAKELKITGGEMEALQAAALLHDIGKLAIPEHIISKPGKLTPEEFEKMKIHPVVGAEILERVRFPYPVVPIVRAHHEKYDGSGYPFGLRGEEIPIGARILSAVDFLDAMASDRQYRRALPLDDVMARLQEESGKSFDPKVVAVLRRRYVELERQVKLTPVDNPLSKLSTEVKMERDVEPAAGYAKAMSSEAPEAGFLSSIASARQEAQTLLELSQDLGASLSLGETLSVFSVKLRRLVPYDAVAIYVKRNNELLPEYVSGDNFRLFASLRIPLGQGLSGWVAQNKKPIVNGNPSVEPGYMKDPTKFSTLRSALAVPLVGLEGVVGVLALYNADKDAFTADHLRVLLAVSSKMALAVENALKYQQAESSATTDYLTGLPNARSLFVQLDRDLARCKRDQSSLTVMVCDMDGFKQINDRFGHLEGNRVLKLFAHALKETCREYDYVARMGGDEFVLIAPGLVAEDAKKKGDHLRVLVKQVGQEVCGEDFLSLSVGRAAFPEDGSDAEGLLAEADRRMYIEKQSRTERKNRRAHPRLKGRLTIEMHPEHATGPTLANLTDISLGGCYVETMTILRPDTTLKLVFSIDDGKFSAIGTVLRMDPGKGIAVQFKEGNREQREELQRIVEYVDRTTKSYDNYYLSRVLSK